MALAAGNESAASNVELILASIRSAGVSESSGGKRGGDSGGVGGGRARGWAPVGGQRPVADQLPDLDEPEEAANPVRAGCLGQ